MNFGGFNKVKFSDILPSKNNIATYCCTLLITALSRWITFIFSSSWFFVIPPVEESVLGVHNSSDDFANDCFFYIYYNGIYQI